MVESTLGRFRLNEKEASYLDTLTLIWNEFPSEGVYKIPIEIGGLNVGYFAARQFDAEINSQKKVGIISAYEGSPILTTVKRLGFKYVEVDPEEDFSNQIRNLDVLIIDKRALSLKRKLKDKRDDFIQFVENGGHLIILAQDAHEWNRSNIWEEIVLTPSQKFDETYPLKIDWNHQFFAAPNKIATQFFTDWLFLRAYNNVQVKEGQNLSVPVVTEGEELPSVLTKKLRKGRLTYIDLALHPQLLNIHTGVFRFLANVISI